MIYPKENYLVSKISGSYPNLIKVSVPLNAGRKKNLASNYFQGKHLHYLRYFSTNEQGKIDMKPDFPKILPNELVNDPYYYVAPQFELSNDYIISVYKFLRFSVNELLVKEYRLNLIDIYIHKDYWLSNFLIDICIAVIRKTLNSNCTILHCDERVFTVLFTTTL